MKTVKKISKHEIKAAIQAILSESRTIEGMTFVRAQLEDASICVIHHDTREVTYHKSIAMLVARAGETSDESLLERGFCLLGCGCEHCGVVSWLIDPEDCDLSEVGVGSFAVVAA